MGSLRRRALAMGACAAMMLAALVTTASSASASSSWQLVDEYNTTHPVCYTTSGGTSNLAIDLNGSWSVPINTGASGLPAGVSVAGTPVIDFYYYTLGGYSDSYGTAPIPAGWSNGTGPVRVVPQPDPADYTLDAEGYVSVTVASGRPANSSFNITLWASDGTTTASASCAPCATMRQPATCRS